MPVVIIKPPCGRCGRTDLPVWLTTPPLCDRCHYRAQDEMLANISATLRTAIAGPKATDAKTPAPTRGSRS